MQSLGLTEEQMRDTRVHADEFALRLRNIEIHLNEVRAHVHVTASDAVRVMSFEPCTLTPWYWDDRVDMKFRFRMFIINSDSAFTLDDVPPHDTSVASFAPLTQDILRLISETLLSVRPALDWLDRAVR